MQVLWLSPVPQNHFSIELLRHTMQSFLKETTKYSFMPFLTRHLLAPHLPGRYKSAVECFFPLFSPMDWPLWLQKWFLLCLMHSAPRGCIPSSRICTVLQCWILSEKVKVWNCSSESKDFYTVNPLSSYSYISSANTASSDDFNYTETRKYIRRWICGFTMRLIYCFSFHPAWLIVRAHHSNILGRIRRTKTLLYCALLQC